VLLINWGLIGFCYYLVDRLSSNKIRQKIKIGDVAKYIHPLINTSIINPNLQNNNGNVFGIWSLVIVWTLDTLKKPIRAFFGWRQLAKRVTAWGINLSTIGH
jgi:hypothetical protein